MFHKYLNYLEEYLNYFFCGSGGIAMAIIDKSELWTMVGAIIAGSGFIGLLGSIMVHSIPILQEVGLSQSKRFLINWICGFSSLLVIFPLKNCLPTIPVVFVALISASVFSLIGLIGWEIMKITKCKN